MTQERTKRIRLAKRRHRITIMKKKRQRAKQIEARNRRRGRIVRDRAYRDREGIPYG